MVFYRRRVGLSVPFRVRRLFFFVWGHVRGILVIAGGFVWVNSGVFFGAVFCVVFAPMVWVSWRRAAVGVSVFAVVFWAARVFLEDFRWILCAYRYGVFR